MLKGIGIQDLPDNVPVSLKNRNELITLMPNSPTISGLTNSSYAYVKDAYGRIIEENISFEIFVLDMLPKLDFESVLAHEYLHVWLYMNKLDYGSTTSEGFCNIAKALIYEDKGGKFSEIQLKKMNDDPDPNYGRGYRIMKKCLDYYGWKKFIKMINNNQASYCY